ncbi:AAA family ATPase [Enterovibrio baiacu]|uniref:AAA family ATPase n=1 Tax=Enterovibrio baiacu TaxID=2491023 RepID=UPI003D11E316
MIALDLDTQIQLLSRIQFLTRFSSNLVQVTGESGAGKTWLSERYLENWANEPNQSLLICNPSQQDAQHRAIILRQIVRDGVFNENDPMLQSLEYMLEGQSIHTLIVIDEAHRLSATLIAELWALVTEAQQRENWQINVLLFSLRGKLNKWLQKVSYGQGVKPLELEISPLAENEREMFIEVMMVSRQLDAAQRRALKQKAALLPPLPGALKGLEQQETSSMEEKKRRSLLPLLILAFLLLVAGAGIVWWTLTQQSTENVEATDVIPDGVKELSELLDEKEAEMAKQNAANTDGDETTVLNADAVDDNIALPEDPTVEGMTVGRRDENRRIVVPDRVVDAIIDDQAIGGDGTAAVDEALIPELVEQNPAPATTVSEGAPAAEPAATQAPAANTEPAPAPLAPVPQAVNVTLSNAELLAISETRYALQLAALQSKAAVVDFLQQYDIENTARVYETVRNEEAWYMILIGDYPSVNAARRAELELSANVRRLTPWVKSFAQIHKEIALAN